MSAKRLEVREYVATDEFRAIIRHVAITQEDGSLVAVTGPARDAESIQVACEFAAAPAMRDLLERVREELVEHHDTVDGAEGPRPNWAMQLTAAIDEELGR